MLTDRMKKFAMKYIETGDVYISSKEAGYSETYAKSKAYLLLERMDIQQFMNESAGAVKMQNILASDREYNISNAGRVLEFFSDVMEGRVKDEIVNVVVNSEGESSVVITKVNPKTRDRIEAGKQLAKRYGLDKVIDSISDDDVDKDVIRVEIVQGRDCED